MIKFFNKCTRASDLWSPVFRIADICNGPCLCLVQALLKTPRPSADQLLAKLQRRPFLIRQFRRSRPLKKICNLAYGELYLELQAREQSSGACESPYPIQCASFNCTFYSLHTRISQHILFQVTISDSCLSVNL